MCKKILITSVFVVGTLFIGTIFVSAQGVSELRSKIEDYNDKISKLDEEIKIYEKELLEIGSDKQTLQNAINELNVSRKKLSTDIDKTENQISKTNLTIEQLTVEISNKEERIENSKGAIAKTLQEISIRDNTSIIEILLNQGNIADFWSQMSELQSLNNSIQSTIKDLEGLKLSLQQRISENKQQVNELIGFKDNLANQKQAVDANKKEKDSLLSSTQNKESTYQSILKQKQAAREQFEADLLDFESQLKFVLDPNSIPQKGSGALAWPFNSNSFNPLSTITQQFGKTAYSGRLYASGTHNGTDFGIPSGSEIRSSASGVVHAVGNTDVGRCLSYGKWILVDHENGLSTLYAHLSSINTKAGTVVNRGSLIGYSGSTGYSTGPHLHFTVFAREGVQVSTLTGTSPCAQQKVLIPVAAAEAYFDPMSYLPR